MDKQIVDIDGRKVVRVNDLRLDEVEGSLRLVAVDVGAAGLLRRLGIEGPYRTLARNLRLPLPERYIDWEDVDPVETLDRLDQAARAARRPGRAAPGRPGHDHRPARADATAPASSPRSTTRRVADAIEEMEPETQVEVLEDLEPERAADILEEMSPDDAADLVADLSETAREEILALMEHDEAAEVQELLRYPEDSAGGIMTTEFVAVPATLTAAQTIDRLRELEPDAETIYYVYVVDDDGRLVGVLSLRDLIVAPSRTRVDRGRDDRRAGHGRRARRPGRGRQVVARYNLLAVPVVDDERPPRGHRHRRRRDRHGPADGLEAAPAAPRRARPRPTIASAAIRPPRTDAELRRSSAPRVPRCRCPAARAAGSGASRQRLGRPDGRAAEPPPRPHRGSASSCASAAASAAGRAPRVPRRHGPGPHRRASPATTRAASRPTA